MGGNALSVKTVRLSAARYQLVQQELIQQFQAHFPSLRIESILAFADKPDFGDLDLLIAGGEAYDPHAIAAVLKATEVVRNGDVTSIGIALDEGIFQVDLIQIAATSFDFAARYFAFNDLGNLLGRIAHKFGAKLGHAGLHFPLRDAENSNHMLAEITITTDFSVALQLLGYEAERYETLRATQGFKSLQDIFNFVITSRYVNRDIYLLENRNHASRIRDRKRPTYTAFLAWLDQQDSSTLPSFPWAESGSEERKAQNAAFLQQAFQASPKFEADYQQTLADVARKKMVRRQFNGELAKQVTGLQGKALGELMASVRNSFASEAAFEDFFLESTAEQVAACYLLHAGQMQ